MGRLAFAVFAGVTTFVALGGYCLAQGRSLHIKIDPADGKYTIALPGAKSMLCGLELPWKWMDIGSMRPTILGMR